MSGIVDRYDRDAQDYERYWAPVLDASARALVDRVTSFVASLPGPPRIVDVGTGSGVLAFEAWRRWPGAVITGVDPSVGMLTMAGRRAISMGVAQGDGDLRWLEGDAAAIPLPSGSVDLALSSFALQLVPDRGAALREALRVIRPGGMIAAVTWLDTEDDFAPSVEFDEAVIDLGVPEPADDEEERSGDYRSRRAAADEFRRAGFERVSARQETLAYSWTPASYLEFKEHYDDAFLFELLAGRHADDLRSRARERLAALPPEAFTWRTPLVSVVARRPARG
jgi:SAM-dependent methyltransferase